MLKSLPALAVRFWRWTVPVALTALAATLAIIFRVPIGHPSDVPMGYRAGSVTIGWIIVFILTSLTILYYRALIWLGERVAKALRRIAVPAVLVLGAIAPPWIHNFVVEREI